MRPNHSKCGHPWEAHALSAENDLVCPDSPMPEHVHSVAAIHDRLPSAPKCCVEWALGEIERLQGVRLGEKTYVSPALAGVRDG